MTSRVGKSFQFTLIYDVEDEDIWCHFTRADDARSRHQVLANQTLTKVAGTMPNDGKKWTVGHINGNMFDNRRCNLRWELNSTQKLNQKKNKRNTSNHIGVHIRHGTKWRAQCRVKGEKKFQDFPLTEEGLKEACALYRTWNPHIRCDVCQLKQDPELKMSHIQKTFDFTIWLSNDDVDILSTFTRPADIRHLSYFCQSIMKRKGKKPSKGHTIDHIDINISIAAARTYAGQQDPNSNAINENDGLILVIPQGITASVCMSQERSILHIKFSQEFQESQRKHFLTLQPDCSRHANTIVPVTAM